MSQPQQDHQQSTANTASALLGQFASSLTHDLRTSLTVIRFALSALRRAVPPGDQTTESLDLIDSEVAEINSFLSRLIEITRPQEMQLVPVELAPVIQEAIARIDNARMAAWSVDIPPDAATLECDRTRIRQVFQNLFHNALAATKGRGNISITARRDSDIQIIDVHDDGCGVSDAVRAHIFEPFVTTRDPGMGLGLTYCREIINRHGGTIELLESSPAGSTFRLRLPAV